MTNIEENKERFLKICRENIHRDGIEDLLDWLCKSDFFVAPASTKFHCAYAGGLCEHSLNVYDCMKRIVSNYPDMNITDEAIAVTALYHDICKSGTYRLGYRNVKNDATGQWERREVYEIDEKFPIGHGEKSCIILQWFLTKLPVDWLMAIRYHMSGFDPAVKGGDFCMSKAYEMTPIAPMLHMADLEATYLIESRKGQHE